MTILKEKLYRVIYNLNTPYEISIQIRKISERTQDLWLDMGLRTIRQGDVRFYRINDPLTGKWLFKICRDREIGRSIVKALKCPSGIGFVQLEGRAMLFQKSRMDGYTYDVISLSYLDDKNRLRRKVIMNSEEIPESISQNFQIMSYEEATGKKAIGKRFVTLCEENDEKKMILLFIYQRAWPLSKMSPNVATKMTELLKIIKKLERAKKVDIFNLSEEQLELTKEDTDTLLKSLENEGKIFCVDEYIKTKP